MKVSANSIFDFGTSSGSSSVFTFSGIDLDGYGGASTSLPILTINNAVAGAKIIFNADYSNNSAFYTSGTSVHWDSSANTFASKIQFGGAGQFGQISFGNGQTTLLVAIPDARVYTAAVVLLVLIGVTEYRRRRRPCRR